MKSLYVSSVERYSGKTAVCLGLGKRFQSEGFQVGYLKPLSLQPWMIDDHVADEDAAFVKEVLNLDAQPWELSPVVVTPQYLRQHLTSDRDINMMGKLEEAIQKAGTGKDILLLEGGGSMREGYVVGLPTPTVAKQVSSDVLMIVKYRDEVRVLDDALASKARLSESLCGVFINRIPENAASYVQESVVPYLERHGVPVFGVLPEVRTLAALTVGEIIDTLQARVLTENANRNALVENLTVGAMNAEAALSRFRKQKNKAVITGGDRTDIQLAALETSTACLILTGNLRPSPLIIKQAENFRVTVILVPTNTMETVEELEQIYGKTRLGQPAKLQQFQKLLEEHVNFDRLFDILELEK